MIETTRINDQIKLTATAGILHKKDTDIYVPSSIVLLPGESIDMYEEVAEKPAYTKAEYDSMVASLVRERYSAREEFAILRKAINAAFSASPARKSMSEYEEYNAYVEECKRKARATLKMEAQRKREESVTANDQTQTT